jgi:LuxR family maltose regulon positive regulatory protein
MSVPLQHGVRNDDERRESRMPVTQLSLLSTKLNRPPAPADQVGRPRLIAMLDRGLAGPLTVVSGAAGFGKTTLVSSWIETLGAPGRTTTPTVWLSLDPLDSDLGVFLRYIVAGIRTAYPDACSETLAFLKAPVPSPQAPLLITLANEIELLPGRLVLVLDDYHVIHGDEVHDFLAELLRHWPARLHLVLIARTSPPLPLAGLRAKGRLTEIRTRDLRFTSEESAAFLSKSLSVPLSQGAMDLLDQRLEGWVAGLRLVTLSLARGTDAEHDLAAVSGTNVEFADYLVDEVLSYQTPVVLKFLLATSIFGRFCAELCEHALAAIGGLGDCAGARLERLPHDVAACIRGLQQHNLFIISLDDQGEWYRYHPLFQELLQRRLAAEFSPEEVAALHGAAARWFGERGIIEEALHHALQTNDLNQAASVVMAGLQEVLNREDRATLDRWLNLLPEDFIRQHPWLLVIKAFAFQFSWRLSSVGKLLAQIEALLDQGGEVASRAGSSEDLRTLRGLMALLRGQQLFHRCQAQDAIASCEEALALLPEGWRYPRGGARLYWGLSMRAIGNAAVAQRILSEEFETLTVKTDAYALRLPFAMAFNFLETGHLDEARRMAQVMLDLAVRARLVIVQGHAHFFLGTVHYCWNELDAAAEHFQRGMDMRYITHSQAARSCMLGMAQVRMARAEYDKAWEVLELLGGMDTERTGTEGEDAHSLRAQLKYLQGDTEVAFRWADSYPPAVPDRLVNWFQDPHLVTASLLVARGAEADLEAALGILDALNRITEGHGCTRLQTAILTTQAVALEKQGKSVAALNALEQAVEYARISGCIRIFVDQGAVMRTLLLRLAGRGSGRETVRRILAAFPQVTERVEPGAGSRLRAANAELVEPLSDRELEVLVLLRERLSNKEIAQRLDLSIMTVKRHACNIYSKLGVEGRRDAVVRAEDLRILPPL